MTQFKEIYACSEIAMYVGEELIDQSEFDFRYVIQMDDHPDRDKEVLSSIMMVPSPEYVADWAIHEIMESSGLSDGDVYSDDVDSWWFTEAARYNGTPVDSASFVHESVYEGDGICVDAEFEDVEFHEAIIEHFAAKIGGFNLMSGFVLDRAVNRVGTTGWGWLRLNGTVFRQSEGTNGVLISSKEDIPSWEATIPNTLHRYEPFSSLKLRDIRREDNPQQVLEEWIEEQMMGRERAYLGATNYDFFGCTEASLWEVRE